MRLEISRRSDLATRALLDLTASGSRTKSAALADRIGTTPGFLSQVMTPLIARGWVRSEPGPAGGYLAVVNPDDVSVLEVIEAVEGPTDTGACVLYDRPCGEGGQCALHVPWASARAELLSQLAGTPLSRVAESSGR
ncbi:MAG: Rrf2 family transcriptional regulator [Acidimicrobiia bacterium]